MIFNNSISCIEKGRMLKMVQIKVYDGYGYGSQIEDSYQHISILCGRIFKIFNDISRNLLENLWGAI